VPYGDGLFGDPEFKFLGEILKMLSDIELATLARLEEKGLAVKAFQNQAKAGSLTVSAISCAVGNGTMRKIGLRLKWEFPIYLVIEFKNLKSEEDRRKGIYPILEAAINFLFLQDLGMGIDPLVPSAFRDITTEEEEAAGRIVFGAEIKTGFTTERMEDEQAEDLLKVGLNYFLKPGDEVADASDEVTLEA